MRKIFQNIQNRIIKIVGIIQKFLVVIFLIITYYIGVGITYILALIFNRKLLWVKKPNENTFWLEAESYESYIENFKRQS